MKFFNKAWDLEMENITGSRNNKHSTQESTSGEDGSQISGLSSANPVNPGIGKCGVVCGAESPEIGKGGWPGTAELAAAQPTVHVNLNMTTPRVANASRTNPLSVYIVYNWPLSTHPPIEEIMIQGVMLILMILFDDNRPKTTHTVPDSRNHFGRRKNWPSLNILQPCVVKAMQLMV